MDIPDTIEGWVKEIFFFYSKSLADHMDLYYQEANGFFYRQYRFASEYSIEAREAIIDKQKIEDLRTLVLHYFAVLPEEYDSQAAETDFAFAFCYLYANCYLKFIDIKMVWEILAYITHHWDECDALIEIPDGIY
ncbi:MAG: hypothetical protein PF692_12560 [Kiritimatiellae bacterium]|jgi:hypothetical protein|nr:hypothetical protein [Kiritimatiellia bacterium]